LPGYAAQHIVCLIALNFQARDVKSIHDLANSLDLGIQFIGHLFAGAFIFREDIVAECASGVKSNCQVIWVLLF
jgi:hypothetical protein